MSRLDKNGIPQLSSNDIEMKAEEVIEFFRPEVLRGPCQTPIESFAEETALRFSFVFDSSRDLGQSSFGHKILGMYSFQPRMILIDKSLAENPRRFFTLGHEYGHFVLHRNLIIKKKGYSDMDISDTEHDLVTGKKVLSTPRDWLEWQANRFASAILMPRATIHDALVSVQDSLGIRRNLGRIYLGPVGYSILDYQGTILGLQHIYKVTRTNLRFRLKELGLLIDTRRKDVKHISELLREG